MNPQTIDKAEQLCSIVEAFLGVISKQDVNLNLDAFSFTCSATKGFRYPITEKEYNFGEWSLFVSLQSEASVRGGEVVVHETEVHVMNLYNEDGEQALVPTQEKELEAEIIKTIVL